VFSLRHRTFFDELKQGYENLMSENRSIAALAQEFLLSRPDIGRNGFLGIFRPD
jgi:hypothetical protein